MIYRIYVLSFACFTYLTFGPLVPAHGLDTQPPQNLTVKAGISEMVEEWFAPFVNYVKVIMTRSEMSSMARAINVKAVGKNLVPTPANFRQYVRDTMSSSRDPSIDMWGSPYVLERKGKAAFILCFGPDKKRGTADDLRTELSLP